MFKHCPILAVVMSLGVLCGAALGANEFSYQFKIGTGSWSSATNFNAATATTIALPSALGSSNIYLRIYDNNVGTLDDLGRITITGSTTSGAGRLKVAVWRDFTQDFPTLSTTGITALGAAFWSGLSFNDPGSSFATNLALLKRTDLAASIRDDLTGNIDVGRVFTLQVNCTLQSDGSVVGGNIDGQVRAWEEDVFASGPAFDDPPTTASIEYVRAGKPRTVARPLARKPERDGGEVRALFPHQVQPSGYRYSGRRSRNRRKAGQQRLCCVHQLVLRK